MYGYGNPLNSLFAGGMGILVLVIFLVYWLFIPFLGRWLAIEKGYSSLSWFWLCFFFGIFALIAISGAPDKRLKNRDNSCDVSELNKTKIADTVDNELKKCNNCGRMMAIKYKSCTNCGGDDFSQI